MEELEKTQKLDIEAIKKTAKVFQPKALEMDNFPLVKKEDIENEVFIVYNYSLVKDELGKVYYNFKCLDKKDNPFVFNGSIVLVGQLEEFGLPAKVKLVKKERSPPNKLKPFYWIFAAGE